MEYVLEVSVILVRNWGSCGEWPGCYSENSVSDGELKTVVPRGSLDARTSYGLLQK